MHPTPKSCVLMLGLGFRFFEGDHVGKENVSPLRGFSGNYSALQKGCRIGKIEMPTLPHPTQTYRNM
jgi:hypothetical protein